jgi:hypothetical protein
VTSTTSASATGSQTFSRAVEITTRSRVADPRDWQ